MLIGAPIAGLLLGLLAGGRLDNLASIRLRAWQALFVGLFLRYAVQAAIENGNDPAIALRLPLFAAGFLCLLGALWLNREHPGIPLAFVGILLNMTAMVINGGSMPVWAPAIAAAGLPPDSLGTAFHVIVQPSAAGLIGPDFLLRAIPLGDIVPIPVPGLRNVASLGDFFLAGGLAFFLFASTVRTPIEQLGEGLRGFLAQRPPLLPEDLAGGEALDLEVMGVPLGEGNLAFSGAGAAVAAMPPSAASLAGAGAAAGLGASGGGGVGGGIAFPAISLPAAPPILERVRRHPFVRLALDSSFSALWTGQLISLVGDRVHQVALAFLVLRATGSPIAVGAVFLVSTLPNLVVGPIAGTLVDRWDHREVMIVSDLLRAGLVLLIPIAAVTNLVLVFPLVFLVTTISIFFRPAKVAILPRMVEGDDLVAANSALWIAETFADIGGFALAGLFVALLGSQLPLAFWVDAMTYVASAVLIASIAVAPLRRGLSAAQAAAAEAEAQALAESGASLESVDALASVAPGSQATATPGFFGELREGWRFMRSEPVVFANTMQAAVAQMTLGIFLALTPVFADRSIDHAGLDSSTAYSFMEGAIGAGNLIGGFVIGLLGARLALGRLVIVGYVATGLAITGLALSGNVYVAVALAFGAGVGNLAFVIPSQTLVQRRTPPELMGRVIGMRFAIVFGSMTVAMGVGGILGEVFGAAPVIGIFGLVTVAAGLAGLLTPAVRDA